MAASADAHVSFIVTGLCDFPRARLGLRTQDLGSPVACHIHEYVFSLQHWRKLFVDAFSLSQRPRCELRLLLIHDGSACHQGKGRGLFLSVTGVWRNLQTYFKAITRALEQGCCRGGLGKGSSVNHPKLSDQGSLAREGVMGWAGRGSWAPGCVGG